MKLNVNQIDILKDKKIITQVISSDQLTDLTVDDLKIKELITLTDPSNEIEKILTTEADNYFTTESLIDGAISFNILKGMGTDMIRSISYSTDGGSTWVTTENQNDKIENLSISISVKTGDEVLWKGDADQMGYYDGVDEGDYIGSFFAGDKFNVSGNIMSLLYGDSFANKTVLEKDGCFAYLFSDYFGGQIINVVDASNLILPATTLADGCYYSMFNNCTSLITAPALPATTLTNRCYDSMFNNCTSLTAAPALPATTLTNRCYDSIFNSCTSLTTAPELPATTLANGCYFGMFYGCTSLTTAPELPATTLANGCYTNMFNGCTSLTAAPELPATTLAAQCYSGMFSRCTSLTTAPELPATTLANGCYNSMFVSCTSLTTAPVLPATTLAERCYSSMFSGCTSLTTAPELPATTLANGCYNSMFSNCSKLSYVKAMFTTTPSGYATSWLQSVSPVGTFVKNADATWDVTGPDGIPSGWTVETASVE